MDTKKEGPGRDGIDSKDEEPGRNAMDTKEGSGGNTILIGPGEDAIITGEGPGEDAIHTGEGLGGSMCNKRESTMRLYQSKNIWNPNTLNTCQLSRKISTPTFPNTRGGGGGGGRKSLAQL